jgi:membrane-associated phospholipid phosphatase
VLLACALLVFVGIALAIDTGALESVDQWSADHLMIWIGAGEPSWISRNIPLFNPGYHPRHPVGALAVNIVRLPAGVPVWVLFYLAGLVILVRRQELRVAATFASAAVLAVAVEVVGKHAVERPAPEAPAGASIPRSLDALSHSFPSGHMLRATILVGLAAMIWPRLTPILVIWLTALGILLVLGGIHLPSDVIGGVAAGVVLILVAALLSRASTPTVDRCGDVACAREDGARTVAE